MAEQFRLQTRETSPQGHSSTPLSALSDRREILAQGARLTIGGAAISSGLHPHSAHAAAPAVWAVLRLIIQSRVKGYIKKRAIRAITPHAARMTGGRFNGIGRAIVFGDKVYSEAALAREIWDIILAYKDSHPDGPEPIIWENGKRNDFTIEANSVSNNLITDTLKLYCVDFENTGRILARLRPLKIKIRPNANFSLALYEDRLSHLPKARPFYLRALLERSTEVKITQAHQPILPA